MPQKIYHSVNTFNAGEISELLFNREDITKYKSACRILENAFPLVEGGAKKMPGTYFAGPAINTGFPCRLVPFQFSTAQGAILELSATSISGGGIMRIWEPTSPGTFTLGLVTVGGSPLTVPIPYIASDLFELDCGTQSADVLWIFHPNYPPGCVERLGPSNWVYNTFPPGGPLVVPGYPAYRGTPDVVTVKSAGLGVSILQITQAFPLVLITDAAFNYGDRIYINLCAGMVELNEGEFFVTPVLQTSDQAVFTGHIDDTAGTPGAGLVLTVTTATSGTILVGMQINGPNVSPNSMITAYLSGSGGTGTYQVNIQQRVQSGTGMTGQGGFAYNLIAVGDSTIGFAGLWTASISGTVMTVTAVGAGVLPIGGGIYYPGVSNGTIIVSQLTGTPQGIGTYLLNISQSASSQRMSSVPVVSTAYLPYVGGGFAVKVIPFFANSGDYPTCGTFYQERLCVAGTDNNPTKLFGSTQDDYPDYICDPNEDDYAIQFTLVSNQLDQIINAIGTPNVLLLGTAGGVWVVAGSTGSSLSQSNVTAAKQTTIGVSQLQPQLVGDSAIFVSRSAKQVMFLSFDFVSNEWNSYDLTRLNRQITIGASAQCSGVIQTAFQSEPYPIFWFVRADGQLVGLVFNKQDQVFAWFRVNMLPEGGIVESVAVISGSGIEDMIVVEVQRNINGSVVRYVEYFYPQELFNDLANAFFVHCGLQLNLGPALAITNITNANPCVVTAPGHNFVNGSFVQIANVIGDQGQNTGMWQVNQDKMAAYVVANSNPGAGTFQLQTVDSTLWGVYIGGGTALIVTNVVTGLSYLLGQTVVAVGDCQLILPPSGAVVTSDSITFQYYCAQITIGLPYKVTIQPTNPVASSPVSTTRGQKQKLNRVTISLYQSLGGEYGVDLDAMYPIVYGPGSVGGDQP